MRGQPSRPQSPPVEEDEDDDEAWDRIFGNMFSGGIIIQTIMTNSG